MLNPIVTKHIFKLLLEFYNKQKHGKCNPELTVYVESTKHENDDYNLYYTYVCYRVHIIWKHQMIAIKRRGNIVNKHYRGKIYCNAGFNSTIRE